MQKSQKCSRICFMTSLIFVLSKFFPPWWLLQFWRPRPGATRLIYDFAVSSSLFIEPFAGICRGLGLSDAPRWILQAAVKELDYFLQPFRRFLSTLLLHSCKSRGPVEVRLACRLWAKEAEAQTAKATPKLNKWRLKGNGSLSALFEIAVFFFLCLLLPPSTPSAFLCE